MSQIRNLTGQRFGRLLALKPFGRNSDGVMWLCRCDCGNEKAIARGALTSKNGTRSCGCLVNHEDLSGRYYGNLTVKEEYGRTSDGKYLWKCICNCGNETIVRGNYLKNGHTKTCGHCFENTYEIDYEKRVVYSYTQNGILFCFDLDDYEYLKDYRWHNNPPHNYICTTIGRKRVPMHIILTNPEHGELVDHINRIKTDNRRCNLRIVCRMGNSANIGLQNNNKSGAKGVRILPTGKYKARIGYDYRTIELGTFDTYEEAAQAYDEAAYHYFGDCACTNKMIQKELQGVFCNA